jgi:hypothetical protein
MEKEFVPYELALALKQLGFDEPCIKGYTEEYKELISFANIHTNTSVSRALITKPFTAPLYQQVFRWFREKCNHYAFLQPTSDLISENYCFKILDQYSGKFYSKSYETYEEAEIECLKKLIEIVKQLK